MAVSFVDISVGYVSVFEKLKAVFFLGVESLCQDFKKVLLGGQNYDLILKVGDKELQAHRDILRARSHVFESMLSHDMMEKNSGVIDVPDCDPHAMEVFLLYVYCGKVEILEDNMLGLYYIADKYEMEGLKNECRIVIKKSLSHTNICEVIQLALNHSDSNLLEHITEYFCDNVLDIMYTVEWQAFMKDNTTVANELTIKSFKKLKMLTLESD